MITGAHEKAAYDFSMSSRTPDSLDAPDSIEVPQQTSNTISFPRPARPLELVHGNMKRTRLQIMQDDRMRALLAGYTDDF
jgi:hypothetical protein